MSDETPESRCPKCGVWAPDLDGFGTLHCPACGHCEHPSLTAFKGVWTCDLCRKQLYPTASTGGGKTE